MLEKIIIDNGIMYQLVGEIYYPVFIDTELPIGIYAQKRIEFLTTNNLVSFNELYTKYQFHYEMFCLNCYCEQFYQNLLIDYLKTIPTPTKRQLKDKQAEIKNYILNTFIFQSKEVIYNGKELEITK